MIFETAPPQKLYATISKKAHALRHYGEWEQAIHWLNIGQTLLAHLPLQAAINAQLAGLEMNMGRLDLASKRITEAFTQTEQLPPAERSAIYLAAGDLAHIRCHAQLQGDGQATIAAYTKAISILTQQNAAIELSSNLARALLAESYNKIAAVYYQQSQTSTAAGFFELALAQADHEFDPVRLPALLFTAYDLIGKANFPAARHHLKTAYTIATTAGSHEDQIAVLIRLAELASAQSAAHDQVLGYLDAALTLADEIQHEWLIAQLLFLIGSLYSQYSFNAGTVDNETAQAYLESADQQANKLSYRTLSLAINEIQSRLRRKRPMKMPSIHVDPPPK